MISPFLSRVFWAFRLENHCYCFILAFVGYACHLCFIVSFDLVYTISEGIRGAGLPLASTTVFLAFASQFETI